MNLDFWRVKESFLLQRFNKSRVVLVPELSFGDDILSWSILSINLVSDCFVFLCISLQLLYCLYPYHLIIISLSVPCKADWPAMFYSQNIFNKLPQCLWQQPFTSATFQFKCFNHKSISTSMILWDPSEPACVVLVFLFLKVMQKIGKCFSSHFSFLPPPHHTPSKKKACYQTATASINLLHHRRGPDGAVHPGCVRADGAAVRPDGAQDGLQRWRGQTSPPAT